MVHSTLSLTWPAKALRKKRWLIGVSGGVDSMALLHFLKEQGFTNLIVCHLDHRLRGRASTEDARFVKKISTQLGYPCITAKIDLLKENAHRPLSLETAARKARHQFFASCSKLHRCKRLLLAHHLDEQAETILWNLIRGSFGLRGMKDTSLLLMDGVPMEVHRPLLKVRKAELIAWMEERKLRWREDASNTINNVARNQIRNEVLPLLSEIAKREVQPLIAQAARADESLREAMSWALSQAQVLDPQGRLHLAAMRALPKALQLQAMFNYLKSKKIPNIGNSLLDLCMTGLDPQSPAKINLPGGHFLQRRAGRMFVHFTS